MSEQVARSLESDRGARVKFASDTEYVLAAQALMPMIRLTARSAAMFYEILALDDRNATIADVMLSGHQGRPSAAARKAVELRAVEVAIEHFAADWEVRDVGDVESYDLDCRQDGRVLQVEVKGSTGNADRVVLTANEVLHAQGAECEVALAVVSAIVLKPDREGVVGTGGDLSVWHPWSIDDGVLTPSAYYYTPPGL